MTEEKDGTVVGMAEARADVIAGFRLCETLDVRAEGLQPGRQHGAASIHRPLVGAGRLRADERLQRLEQPGTRVLGRGENVERRPDRQGPDYRSRLIITHMVPAFIAAAVVCALAAGGLAQTPQPFPRPGEAREQQPPTGGKPAGRGVLPPKASTPDSPASQDPGEPTEATLGMPIYPGAQFVVSYNAGRGQRYYLFGTNADFSQIVNYYRNVLKQRGDLIYQEPPIHMFEVGRFREETMAFPPGVTVKDYTWAGSAGYLNPKRGVEPARFKTIIQIVPAPAGATGGR